MFMGTQGLHAALIFVVPDPQSLVISTAHNKLSSRVHKNPTDPVIMANLKKTPNKKIQDLKRIKLLKESQSALQTLILLI